MNIAEQREVDQKKSQSDGARASRATTIRALCQHRDGRDFLWWLMEQGSPFTCDLRFSEDGRTDIGRTGYASGWRGLGTLILGEVMDASPQGYVLMLTENRNLKETKDERSSDSAD